MMMVVMVMVVALRWRWPNNDNRGFSWPPKEEQRPIVRWRENKIPLLWYPIFLRFVQDDCAVCNCAFLGLFLLPLLHNHREELKSRIQELWSLSRWEHGIDCMGKEAVSYILFSGSKMNRFDHMCTNWAGVDDDGDDYRANTCEVMYMVVVERRGCRCLEPLYMEMRILQGRGGETDCQAGNGMRKSNFDDGKQCAKVIIADVSIKTCIGPSFFPPLPC